MTYDGKCYDLARCFLSDEDAFAEDEKAIGRVAQRIQDAIESEIEWLHMDAEEKAVNHG